MKLSVREVNGHDVRGEKKTTGGGQHMTGLDADNTKKWQLLIRLRGRSSEHDTGNGCNEDGESMIGLQGDADSGGLDETKNGWEEGQLQTWGG